MPTEEAASDTEAIEKLTGDGDNPHQIVLRLILLLYDNGYQIKVEQRERAR